MQRFLSIALALCLGLTLSLDASAKRLGGGKSLGSAPSHQTTQMNKQQAAPAPAAGTAAAAARPASGASRWLGPLAGIAAGGLLASMFMGDGFEGMQIFDILIFGLIAFLLAGPAGDKIFPYTTQIGIVLLWVAALLTLYTGYDYFRAGLKHIVDNE